MDYRRKIDFAIKLLKEIPKDGAIEVCYSGGKDSDVILELAKMSGINYRAIYKNTSIDPPGTIRHVKEAGAEVLKPTQTFYEIISRKGYPNRFRRFCCEILKEYKVLDRAIQGIRREESTRRAKQYKEPEICRTYANKDKVRVYLPILDWTLEDVTRFIEERGIKCAPIYYDLAGVFHPERRLGCLCCPLMNMKRRRQEFARYPGMLKLYYKGARNWFNYSPLTKSAEKFERDAAKMLHCELFYENWTKFNESISGGLFPEQAVDSKTFLENYFSVKLD